MGIKPSDILDYVTNTYPEVEVAHEGDETALLYNPGGKMALGYPFLSIRRSKAEGDGFRLSVVQPPVLYKARFGEPPKLLENGAFIAGDWEYQSEDKVTPDPVRAPFGWIAVLNPSAETFEDLKPHVAAGLQQAMAAAKTTMDLERKGIQSGRMQ